MHATKNYLSELVLRNAYFHLTLPNSDYFKLPAGTGGTAPFPVSGAEAEEIGDFEARRRKLGYVWISSATKDQKDIAVIKPWVLSSEKDRTEITVIQPIPTSAQMLLGDGEEEEEFV